MSRNEYTRREVLKLAGRISVVVAGGAITAGLASSCGGGGGGVDNGGGTDIGGGTDNGGGSDAVGPDTPPGCQELSSRKDDYGNTYHELSCDSYLYDYGAECYVAYSGVEYVPYVEGGGYGYYDSGYGYYGAEGGYYRYTGRSYRCSVYERAT